MNFDDYDYHILQKCRLAIAIAIVKNTPENLTPKTYFENLRKQIASKMDTFDPDMTICEDDFNFNDNECINNDKINDNQLNDSQFNESVTILKDFDFDEMMRNRNNDGTENNSVSDVLRILKYANNEELEVALSNGSNINHTQSTFYESSQNATQTSTSAKNTETQNKTYTEINSNTNIPKCKEQYAIPKSNPIGPDDTYYDSQKTVLYTLLGFTDFTHVSQSQVENIVIPKHLINRVTIDNELNKVPIDNKNIKSESGLKVMNGNNKVLSDNMNSESSNKVPNNKNNFIGRDKIYPKSNNENNNFIKRNDECNAFSEICNVDVRNNFSTYNERVTKENELSQSSKIKIVKNSNKTYFNENDLSVNSMVGIENNFSKNNERDFKQNKFNTTQIITHIDKELINNQASSTAFSNFSKDRNIRQLNNINEANLGHREDIKKVILKQSNSKHKYENNIENTEVKRPRHENSTNIDSDIAYFNEIRSKIDKQECFTNFDTDLSNNSDLVNETVRNYDKFENKYENSKTTNFNKSLDSDSQNKFNKDEFINELGDSKNFTQFNFDEIKSKNLDKTQNRQSENEIMNKLSGDGQNITQFSMNDNWDKTQNVDDIDQEDMFDNITVSQAEVVPFKVLEELSRIKVFLNKQERQSVDVTDSGYKSDSQSRSTFKSALQSTNWLNQSAHSLLTYLARCPLIIKTADITNEISRILGQLIDRLHEEENYPSFLEEHLSTVEEILKDIYENDVSDNILLKKDENIHRLFLLNRSSHIIKYTIEKILEILENAHTKLTSDIFEINSVQEIENLSYIFHILEVLLKRIIIFKNIPSQSTQSSQDEGILKKSSLTDIWRKKWNSKSSKFESDSNVGYPKKYVLDQCGVILNKIIVQAMDGYSLISFYALQCFNLLQN